MNRICALCKESQNMKGMLRAGKDFLCADKIDCYRRRLGLQKDQCPECGSRNIAIAGEFSGASLEFDGDNISALKLTETTSEMIHAHCESCGKDLIPNKDGYRIKH